MTLANSADPDQTPQNAESDQDLHCLLKLQEVKGLNRLTSSFRSIFPTYDNGEAKVSCILLHRGVQLILAYSWTRPAVLAAGKGRGGFFLFLLFLHCHSFSFLPCPSHLSPILSLLFLFSLSLGDDTK